MVTWRSIPGYVALSTIDGKTLEVRGPAADVWELASVEIDFDALVNVLSGRYAAEPGVVAADLLPLLEKMRSSGFMMFDD